MSARPPVTHYYIWYRVEGDVAAARSAVDAVLRDMSIQCGVAGRVLVKRDDPRTWMEIYEKVGDAQGFEVALSVAVQRHGAGRVAEGGRRHTEAFVPGL